MALPVLVNPNAVVPIFRQIADERAVNPNTVHKAVAGRGRGMVVRAGARSTARASVGAAVLVRVAEAARLADAAGMSAERFDLLVRRAQRAVAAVQSAGVP